MDLGPPRGAAPQADRKLLCSRIVRSSLGNRVFPFALSLLLAFQLNGPAAWAQAVPAQINIVAVRGDGAVVSVGQRPDPQPLIRIEDENRRPLADVVVVFTLPIEGTTGEFRGSGKIFTATTTAQGEAEIHGLAVNRIPGRLLLHVNASYRGLTTRTTMTIFVVSSSGSKTAGGHGKVIAIIAAIGAAAGAGAALGLRKQNNAAVTPTTPTPPPAAISLSPGTGSIGAPPH